MPVPTVFLSLADFAGVLTAMPDVPIATNQRKRVGVGEQVRMFNNDLRSTENAALVKIELTYTTPPMDHTEYAALMVLLTSGKQLVAGGASVNRSGATLNVLATVTDDTPAPHDETEYQRVVGFTLAQV